MAEQQDTIVRRSVRYDVSIRACVAVLPEHAGVLKFAGGSGARDGWVEVDVVDFSSSGVGIMSPVFLPRRLLLTVRLFGPQPGDKAIVEVPVRVQRVCMTDRRPGYLVGTSFADPSPESAAQINRLLQLLAGDDPKTGEA
jgi:hypothetical protein